ncbi:hypothetical protein Purlil1_3571 [Purpureocillium lilacinum]|uniref:Uncharacterized protein n=1 Tax=Purpureocillium lilacinum TaxID=33203 RepID=A0ABR0C8M4_PURLI|nr:hypothetical protein Purlil1_3571 [Purpureocillium lilacinum]
MRAVKHHARPPPRTHTHIHIVGKGTSYARDGRTDGPALGAHPPSFSRTKKPPPSPPLPSPSPSKPQNLAASNVPLTHVSFRSLEGRGGKNGGTHPTTARMRARPLRGDVGGGGTYVGDMPGAYGQVWEQTHEVVVLPRPWATDDAHAWAEPQGNAKTQPSRPADKHPIPIPPILTHSLTHSPRFALQKSIPPSLPLPLTLSSTSSIQGAARPSVAAAAAVAAKWALPFAGSPIQPGGPPLPFPSPPTGGREGRQGQRQKTETAQGPSRDVRPPAHRPPLDAPLSYSLSLSLSPPPSKEDSFSGVQAASPRLSPLLMPPTLAERRETPSVGLAATEESRASEGWQAWIHKPTLGRTRLRPMGR